MLPERQEEFRAKRPIECQQAVEGCGEVRTVYLD
jgi:hypothetical protein